MHFSDSDEPAAVSPRNGPVLTRSDAGLWVVRSHEGSDAEQVAALGEGRSPHRRIGDRRLPLGDLWRRDAATPRRWTTDRRPGGDEPAVGESQPEATHACDEVLGHARHQHVDGAALAATVATGSFVCLHPIDEGSPEELVDGDSNRLGSIDARPAVAERGRADDLGLIVTLPPGEQVVDDRVLGPEADERVDHGRRIAQQPPGRGRIGAGRGRSALGRIRLVSEIDEGSYRAMVEAQSDRQVDTWAADLFIDFAKRRGVGTAIGSFCAVAKLDSKGFQRAFLVGGGPDHVVGIDTAGMLAAPIFELPRAIAGLRRTDPDARRKLVDFLVGEREVMSYTP